jgi:hypothetical protein
VHLQSGRQDQLDEDEPHASETRDLARRLQWAICERRRDMRGVITRKEVLAHPLMIVRLFGPRAYLRCLRAAFSARPTTFLETVFAHPRASRA